MTSKREIEQLLAEEAAESEASRGTERPVSVPPHVAVSRRSRTAPLTIRLSDTERARLEAHAAAHGVGPSTMARTMILAGLDGNRFDEIVSRLDSLTHEVQALRHHRA